MIRPSLYSMRFTESYTSRTYSPSFRFRTCSFDHFDLWFFCGRYLRVHIFQIMSAYDWSVLQIFLRSWLRSLDGMNGALVFSRPSKNWFGVIAVKSSESSLTYVRCLAMRVCSTRDIVVLKTSSVRHRFSKNAIMTFLQLWTCLSLIPPKCGAPGGLNFQTIFFWSRSLSILALSNSFMNDFNLLAPPTKSAPLSLMMVFG